MAFRRPRFFSKLEWWYHLTVPLVLFPLVGHYLVGPRYFQSGRIFALSTGLMWVLYGPVVVVLTVAVRFIFRRFPHVAQAMPRTLTMIPVVGTLIVLIATFAVWIYSLFPELGVQFTWQAVRPITALGFFFGVFMCLALSIFYTHAQWNRDQVLNEQLKRSILQHQFDALKRQLNPHFLFNSLNSLSQLIGDDRNRAEQFVDNLARVYRYLLQAGPDATAGGVAGRLVPLQAELAFMRTYAKLLRARYGESLHIKLWVPPAFAVRYLPHLSLQAVVDHAIQHNVMLPKKPLVIAITPDQEGVLRIQHNRQPKAIRVEAHHTGLEQLRNKYDLLCGECVRVEQTEQFVAVLLPLFASEKPALGSAAQ